MSKAHDKWLQISPSLFLVLAKIHWIKNCPFCDETWDFTQYYNKENQILYSETMGTIGFPGLGMNNSRRIVVNKLPDEVKTWLVREISQCMVQQAERKQDIKRRSILVISKKYGTGKWEIVSKKSVLELLKDANQRNTAYCVCDMEMALNNGMLAEKAEAAYPRMGMHDHAIYKVSLDHLPKKRAAVVKKLSA